MKADHWWITAASIDLIMGEVNGKVEDKTTAENITTKVVERFTEKDWKQDGETSPLPIH